MRTKVQGEQETLNSCISMVPSPANIGDGGEISSAFGS